MLARVFCQKFHYFKRKQAVFVLGFSNSLYGHRLFLLVRPVISTSGHHGQEYYKSHRAMQHSRLLSPATPHVQEPQKHNVKQKKQLQKNHVI